MDKYRSVTGKNPYIWSYEDYEKYEDYKRIGRL
jgi:hypothetical protein